MNFAKKSFKNTFLTEHLWVASSESVSANGPEISFLWTECSDETLSIFWKKSILGKIKNLWNEITENFFFLLPTVYIFDFCKNMNLHLYILFLVDKSMT